MTAQEHHRSFQARLAAQRLEASMPAAQAAIAKSNREAAERRDTRDMMARLQSARHEHEIQRMQDALSSVRLPSSTIATHCITYLLSHHHIPPHISTLHPLVECILYLMILDPPSSESSQSYKILKILDEWTSWSNAGGMKRDQFDMLARWKVEFCLAACVVAVVGEGSEVVNQRKGKGNRKGGGKASVDMLECLGLWRKVRLG